MSKVINIDRRGTLTLPKLMRRRLALAEEGGMLIAEETPDGILLRPGQVIPSTLYSDEDVALFQEADEQLRELLPKLKRRSRSTRKQ